MNGARPNESEILIMRRFEGVGDLALMLLYVECSQSGTGQ